MAYARPSLVVRVPLPGHAIEVVRGGASHRQLHCHPCEVMLPRRCWPGCSEQPAAAVTDAAGTMPGMASCWPERPSPPPPRPALPGPCSCEALRMKPEPQLCTVTCLPQDRCRSPGGMHAAVQRLE